MTDMTKEREHNDKVTKIREILPILWSSYEHMFEVRDTGIKSNINVLMIIVTFLPMLCLALCVYFTSPLFLVPILFQLAALLILLKSFFIKGQIPWFKAEETLQQLDDNSFEIVLFAELKACENGTAHRLQAFRTIIKRALFLVISSIFLIALAYLFMLLKGSILLYGGTVLLVIGFLLLYFAYYKNVPEFDFDKERETYENMIKKWFEDDKSGKNRASNLRS